jgi:hypothetical protein
MLKLPKLIDCIKWSVFSSKPSLANPDPQTTVLTESFLHETLYVQLPTHFFLKNGRHCQPKQN